MEGRICHHHFWRYPSAGYRHAQFKSGRGAGLYNSVKGFICGYLIGVAAQTFKQAFGYMVMLWSDDTASRWAPPQNRVVIAKPGEDTLAIRVY
jgi:hypothetical protein